MNELAERTVNLPDTIEDLTQFVLVGKAKLNAYMLKLQAINKLSVAQEIREQTLKETQELNAALFAAEQRIGELLLAIPKQSGGDRKSDNIKNRGASNFEKSKAETISDMGYTKDEASNYQRMAKNPEIVQKVLDEAVANGTVATKAQVMKEIRKADAEKAELRKEIAERDRKIRELQNRPPEVREVVKEVIPQELLDENESLKKKLDDANSTANRRYDEKKAAEKKLAEVEGRLRRESEELPDEKLRRQRAEDVEYFTASTYTFIKRYGGFVWSKEELETVPKEKVKKFETALFSLDAMVKQMIQNIGGYKTE